ncbi:MAG: hypothetical protein ACLQBJ_04050 [Bryobacteraceae bacterium]
MDPTRHEPFFDQLFGSGADPLWNERAAWRAQKLAWKARRAAWKAQWRSSRRAYRGPVAAVWGLSWIALWIGFGLLLALSPEFRHGFISFVQQIPELAVRALHALAGRAEI